MNGQSQLSLFTTPDVFIPAIRIPQPDGSLLIKAGKPVVCDAEISIAEAAKILGLACRTIQYQCAVGFFKTAYQPGGRPGCKWLLARSEVMARKQPILSSALDSAAR